MMSVLMFAFLSFRRRCEIVVIFGKCFVNVCDINVLDFLMSFFLKKCRFVSFVVSLLFLVYFLILLLSLRFVKEFNVE